MADPLDDALAATPHEITFASIPRVIVDASGAAEVLVVSESWIKANVKYLPRLTYTREPHFLVEDLLRWAREHGEAGLYFEQQEKRRSHREQR